MRNTKYAIWLFLAALLSVSASGNRKNVLFILVDDLGVRDLGIEGSEFYETPNIDELAKSGMRFTQGYANCRVCSPSRASIMLGQYPARHGITDWIGAKTGTNWNRNDRVLPSEYVYNLPKEPVTIAEAFNKAGYKTFFAGKWHLCDDVSEDNFPDDHGFDINVGGTHKGSPPGGYFAPYNNPRMQDGPDGESLPLRLAEETANFIREHKKKPFFAFLSFYSVHGPIQTTNELWKKYREKAIQQGLVDRRFAMDRTMPVRQVQDNPIYAGMMEHLDDAVGIVLDTLKAEGLDENTIVVFTSDNGGVSSGDAFSTSLLPLRGGKGRQWEGGIREPFYVRVPGVTQSESTCDVPVMGADLYPTLVDLTGGKMPKYQVVDGVSIAPLLTGGEIAERDLYWHYPHYGNQGGEPSSVIRSGDWKLIFYHEDARYELYNLKHDISEKRDLATAHPEIVHELKAKLAVWLMNTGAKIPEKDSRFDPEKKERQLDEQRTKKWKQLEEQHRHYLDEDFDPANEWWGSFIAKD